MALHFLLAIDGSSYTDPTTQVAVQLAAAAGARLTVIHVVNVTSVSTGNLVSDIVGRMGFEPVHVSPEVEAEHRKRGEVLLSRARLAARQFGVEPDTELVQGVTADEIVKQARTADLLIMGMRGMGEDADEGRGGGNLEKLLHAALPPVVMVPRKVERIDAVAIGYDGSTGAAHALRALRTLAQAGLKVPVHAIHVGDGASVLDEVVEELDGVDVRKHPVPAGETVHETLAATAVELGADVLAVGFTGQHRWKDVLFGSAADHLIRSQSVALLLAH